MMIKKQPYESELTKGLRLWLNGVIWFIIVTLISLLAIGVYHFFK